MDQLIFRPAEEGEKPRILEIIAQAKAQMCLLGSLQWQDGYPAEADIVLDLRRGNGWVFVRPETETIVAYGAVVFDGEPAYEALDGKWLTDSDYVAVHRLAVADGEKGRGIATQFMLRVADLALSRGIGSFRIDTNFDNHYMLHLFARLGFVFCGKITYQSGERLAYEKVL